MKNDKSDAAFALTRNAVSTRYEDVPAEARRAAKRQVLDLLGVAVAGSTLPGAREVAELVIEGGGKEESTILAYGGKVPCWMAAFANGAMAHVRDYDDTHDGALIHAGAPVIPAAFAIAERVGNVTGKEFITAVVLGSDIVCRMALATNEMNGWMLT